MVTAKPFEFGVPDRPVPPPSPAPSSSRLSRLVSVAQLLGALVAVPAGIGSAYTMYKANFSQEATCQTLRYGIIKMLDRGVDASTRRVLVRRDIEAFERTCAKVEPEASAAFKTLLAADKGEPAATPVAPPPEPQTVRKIETAPPAKTEPAPVVKAEPAPAAKPKQPIAHASAVVVAPVPSQESDSAWLAAVRGALVTHEREPTPTAAHTTAAPTSLAPPPPGLGEMPAPQTLPSAPAPVLPPPATVGTITPTQVPPDHPVPPGAIPEVAPAKKPSRIGEWVGEIPFFGKTLADHVSR